jgi:SAM-dependent methyltransferase
MVRRSVFGEIDRAQRDHPGRPPLVVDVGGGSGAWSVPLAAAGCQVTVVDASPNALATLHRRAAEAGMSERITAVQGDVDALAEVIEPASADLVLGHGLLEVVDDATAAAGALAGAARPGGAVSILVAGRHAAVLARALAGRLGQAAAVLGDPAGRWGAHDPLHRRMDVAGLRSLLEATGLLRVELLHGDGVFETLLPGAVRATGPGALDELAALEDAAAADPALLAVAARLHAIARRLPLDPG